MEVRRSSGGHPRDCVPLPGREPAARGRVGHDEGLPEVPQLDHGTPEGGKGNGIQDVEEGCGPVTEVVPWVLSSWTVLTMFLLSEKNRYGFMSGLASQVLWLAFDWHVEAYGLMPLA